MQLSVINGEPQINENNDRYKEENWENPVTRIMEVRTGIKNQDQYLKYNNRRYS